MSFTYWNVLELFIICITFPICVLFSLSRTTFIQTINLIDWFSNFLTISLQLSMPVLQPQFLTLPNLFYFWCQVSNSQEPFLFSDFFFLLFLFLLFSIPFLFCGCNVFSHLSKYINVKIDLEVFLSIFSFSRLLLFSVFSFGYVSSLVFLRCLLTVGCLLMIHSRKIKMYLEVLNLHMEPVDLEHYCKSIFVRLLLGNCWCQKIYIFALPILSQLCIMHMYMIVYYAYVLCITLSTGITWEWFIGLR